MIYKFLFISDEEAEFMREISIDSEATFLDLHHAILDAVKYDKDAMTSFFICNDDWEKEQEIKKYCTYSIISPTGLSLWN